MRPMLPGVSPFLVLVSTLGALGAGAAPLVHAVASCMPAGGTIEGESDTHAGIASATCDASGTDFSQVPTIPTSASTTGGGIVLSSNLGINAFASVDRKGRASGAADVSDLFATIETEGVTPVPTSSVPLLWSATFDFSLVESSLAATIAAAEIEIFRLTTTVPPIPALESDSFDSSTDDPGSSALLVRFDYALMGSDLADEVQLGAFVSCLADAGGFGDGDCTMSLVTDSLVFDQATFDERMGAETFDLDEYFAIAVVPEPATGLPLGFGLVALAGARRV